MVDVTGLPPHADPRLLMAGVKEGDLYKVGPFTAGLANLPHQTEGPVTEGGRQIALTQAVNVDLDAAGNAQMRRGHVVRVAAGEASSLFPFGDYLLALVDGDLHAYTADGAGALTLAAMLRVGLGPRFVTYATDDFDAYWSNGIEQGRIGEDLAMLPFWVPTPDPVTLASSVAGGLAKGKYEVSVTAIDASGRESAASSPVAVSLQSGQGIAVALPAPPEAATAWRVYVSTPDGDVLYRCAEIRINYTAYTIGAHTPGAMLETDWLHVLPAVDVLRYGHGRLLGIAGGNLLWSEAYRLGLMQDSNFSGLGQEGTLLEPVGEGGDTAGAGWWVADHKRTYWMAGADPESWSQVGKYPHAAVPGCSCVVPGSLFGLETTSDVAFWLARNGVFCLGLPGGTLMPLKERSLGLPVDAERGTAALLMFDGIRQILTSVQAGAMNHGVAGDSAEATVTRKHTTSI